MVGVQLGKAFQDVETDKGSLVGLERGVDGSREARNCSQRFFWERPRDSSDDSSPVLGKLPTNVGMNLPVVCCSF